jgi:hypothetical protein
MLPAFRIRGIGTLDHFYTKILPLYVRCGVYESITCEAFDLGWNIRVNRIK